MTFIICQLDSKRNRARLKHTNERNYTVSKLPKISSYGNYASGNYSAHCLKISFDTIDIYYSYETIIAFSTAETGLVVRQNDWSTVTGKHLNAIDNGGENKEAKKKRLTGEAFEKKLIETLKAKGLSKQDGQ